MTDYEHMNWKQRALYRLMSEISEQCYAAGWLSGNEHRLWSVITDPTDAGFYGQSVITQRDRDDLREISDEIGGWIVWREDGPQYVTFDEWADIRTKEVRDD